MNQHAKISAYLGDEVTADLKDYARRNGMTVTSALRRAIRIMTYLDAQQREGKTIHVTADGFEHEVRFL